MQKMFMIADKNQLMNFIAANQKSNVGWVVKGDRLHFVREKKEIAEIPNLKMMNLSLSYATELNRIIWFTLNFLIICLRVKLNGRKNRYAYNETVIRT